MSVRAYEELPELTDEMLNRAILKRAGRPVVKDPLKKVTIRLPESVLVAWKSDWSWLANSNG